MMPSIAIVTHPASGDEIVVVRRMNCQLSPRQSASLVAEHPPVALLTPNGQQLSDAS